MLKIEIAHSNPLILQARKKTLGHIYGTMTLPEVRSLLRESSKTLKHLPYGDPAYERFYNESSNLLQYLGILEKESDESTIDPFFKVRVPYIYSFLVGDVSDVSEDWAYIYLNPNGDVPTDTSKISAIKTIVFEMLKKRFEREHLNSKEYASVEIVLL